MIATARRLARSSDELGLPLEAARSWLDLAYAAAEALDEPACNEGLGAAHRRYRDAGVDRGLADVLLGMAMREAFMGSPETAAALLSTTATGLLIDQGSYAWYRRCRDRIRAAGLPTAVINAARHGGRLKTVEQAIAEHLNFAN